MTESRHRERAQTWITLGVAFGLLGLSLATRLPSLDGMVNVDMYHLWSPRIARFWNELLSGHLEGTYQSHHPGVTLMWLSGGMWRLQGVAAGPLTAERLRLATLPVLFIGSLFPAATFLLTRKLLGPGFLAAALVGLLFATEPLFLAHSVNAHLDMLVTSFAWSALLTALLSFRSDRRRWALVSGVLLGLSLLTKLSAAGYALGITLVFLVGLGSPTCRTRTHYASFAILVAAAATTVFVGWPALWVAPVATLSKLHGGLFAEVDKVSSFMFLGHTGKLILPRWIYGIFALFLITPEVLLPLATTGPFLLLTRNRFRANAWQLTLGALPFALAISGGARIGVRYMVPLLPWALTLSAFALVYWYERVIPPWRLRRHIAWSVSLLVALGVFRIYRAWQLQPLPITYCSHLLGSDCAEVFHVGWGEGLKEAAIHLETVERKRLGPGPIAIYGSPYASTMGVWTRVKSVRKLEDAQILVDYSSDWQRQLGSSQRISQYISSKGSRPIYEFSFGHRPYVRLYAGPNY